MKPEAMRVAAVAALMAIWWITEAIPIPATALIPIALFPALSVMKSAEVTGAYANHLIYLYLGGFLIAVTIERWNLHRRIALHTIRLVGVTPNRIILGFMVATGFLSMWISNTATAMMMLPIATAVIKQAASMLAEDLTDTAQEVQPGTPLFKFATSLMLGIAYSASIGGIATLIGTPPNAILAGVIESTYGVAIDFASWMAFGLPLSIVMLAFVWFYLTRVGCRSGLGSLPGGRRLIVNQIEKLGPVSKEEKWVLAVFLTVALAWILRSFVQVEALSMVSDSTIAILGALALFLIPSSSQKGKFLLDWKTAVKVPWDIIILFGGGFALADGFSSSGLTEWIGLRLTSLQGMNIVILIGLVGLLVIFLTEITSNTATASLTLPIVAALAEAMQIHPYGLMVVVAVGASFAFMMPVATPPNAIVFSSRYVTIPEMARVGLWLNLVGALILLGFVALWMPFVWDLDLTKFPTF